MARAWCHWQRLRAHPVLPPVQSSEELCPGARLQARVGPCLPGPRSVRFAWPLPETEDCVSELVFLFWSFPASFFEARARLGQSPQIRPAAKFTRRMSARGCGGGGAVELAPLWPAGLALLLAFFSGAGTVLN